MLGPLFRIALIVTITGCILHAQTAVESEGLPRQGAPYPAQWPNGPGSGSVPVWAAPGKIRFSRWDGGRIETAKAFLSGWPGLNPPDPNLLYTMTNWYDLKTIDLLKEAHINLIWITFSVGFSLQTEAAQQEQVRRYIAECHRQGIHVMDYESIANMFWEDMFEVIPVSRTWVQVGPDGKPVPYGAGTYSKMGRTTRYMANLSNPDWRNYLIKRIDLAIDSGADGLAYDNNFGNGLFGLYPALVTHATSRKKDFLIMGNFHPDTYVLNHLLNCITTEDGLEPGLYASSSQGYSELGANHPYLLPIADKFLVNNVGLLRVHEALANGWKPVMIEDGLREHGSRLEALMTASRERLALAENMMYSIALEQFVEGRPAYELQTKDPATVQTWNAVAEYNAFFEEHEALYVGARSVAPLAIVLDDSTAGIPLLDGLASRRVRFNVLYERDATPTALSAYKAVAVLTARFVRDSALAALEEFERSGGTLITTSNAGTQDINGRTRQPPSFFMTPVGSGKAIRLSDSEQVNVIAKTLLEALGEPLVRFNVPDGVLYNITEPADHKTLIVHVLNYTLRPVTALILNVRGTYRSARVISPDKGSTVAHLSGISAKNAQLNLPQLQTYFAVVLDRK